MNLTKMARTLALLIVGVVATGSQAATIRVPQDQATIAAAIAAAQEGDSVLVSSGTYQEHNLTITKGIMVQSASGSSVTTIDGQQIGGTRVFTVNSASTNLAKISGFSIINGNASPTRLDGAGVHWIAGPLLISNCVFSNNYANGGIVGTTTTPQDPTKLKVVDCVFRNNSAENHPGVVGATVVRCLFYNNSAWNNPPALVSCNATNCTIYGNTGGVLGNPWTTGGISGGTAVNCIVWGNSGYNGQQVDQTTSTTVTYSIVQGGYAGSGNLTFDPLFVNAAAGNFNLLPTSPAIDTGDPTAPNDADGTRADMGAFPFQGPLLSLLKAVKPSFTNLLVGTNYQLQVSGDLNTWTNHGAAFTATNTSQVYPQYWDVDNWGSLFFRLKTTP